VSSPSPDAPRFRLHPALLAAAAVYLGLRALVLATNFDQVALPAYELYPSGTLARNLLGPRGDLPLLYCYDNSLGPPLISYLAWASFALFGPSYLALKLVAFATMLPCLFLIWSFLERHCGTRAAILGAWLYVLPPTTLFQYTLLPVGNHAENVTLSLLTAWAFLRVPASPKPLLAAFLAGLCGGIALSIFLGALVPVALVFALHAGLVGRRRALREIPLALAGFFLGIVPLLVANTLAGGARGLSFLSEKFEGAAGGPDWGSIGLRFAQFFTEHLPRAAAAHDFAGIPGGVAEGLFLAAFLAAAALSLPHALRGLAELLRGVLGAGALARGPGALGRAILVPLYLYLPLTALAYALSDLRMGDHAWPLESAGYRYFLVHFLFAILLVALTAARLWQRGGAARALGAVLAAAALLPGLFDLALVDLGTETAGAGARYAGYNVKQTARTLFLNQKQSGLADAELVRIAESYPPPFREQVYFGLGFYEPYLMKLHGYPPELEPSAVLAGYPRERLPDLARGIGALMRHRETAPAELPPEVWQALERYAAEGEPLAELVAEGLATSWSVLLASDTGPHLEASLALLEKLRARVPALSPAAARGLGLAAGRLARREIPVEERRIEHVFARLAADDVEPFLFGLGMGLADGGETPAIPERATAWVPLARAPLVLAGFSARLGELHGSAGAGVARSAPRPANWPVAE
jgi:hypothetical protein